VVRWLLYCAGDLKGDDELDIDEEVVVAWVWGNEITTVTMSVMTVTTGSMTMSCKR
jgi:hypothetical protein